MYAGVCVQVCVHRGARMCGPRLALHLVLQVPAILFFETGSPSGLELTRCEAWGAPWIYLCLPLQH